ncbi:hypothetical protein DENSPDRAFT_717734 [Dentipellis sp. KUC8613]|nr:hypothetical protein DENSPDRAFT_717734 [Dentipellis sp. KUC8613]
MSALRKLQYQSTYRAADGSAGGQVGSAAQSGHQTCDSGVTAHSGRAREQALGETARVAQREAAQMARNGKAGERDGTQTASTHKRGGREAGMRTRKTVRTARENTTCSMQLASLLGHAGQRKGALRVASRHGGWGGQRARRAATRRAACAVARAHAARQSMQHVTCTVAWACGGSWA